jgi:hypothetical protein
LRCCCPGALHATRTESVSALCPQR